MSRTQTGRWAHYAFHDERVEEFIHRRNSCNVHVWPSPIGPIFQILAEKKKKKNSHWVYGVLLYPSDKHVMEI